MGREKLLLIFAVSFLFGVLYLAEYVVDRRYSWKVCVERAESMHQVRLCDTDPWAHEVNYEHRAND